MKSKTAGRRGGKLSVADTSSTETIPLSVTPSESATKDWYMPRDRAVAVFQAAMDEFLDKKLKTLTSENTSKGKTPAKLRKNEFSLTGAEENASTASLETIEAQKKLFFMDAQIPSKLDAETFSVVLHEQFDNLDPGWIEVVWEKAKELFRGKVKFIAHEKTTDFRFTLIDRQSIKIALVSDWGAAENAAAVAAQIKNCEPDYVIHLGDVYYAGIKHEIENRFLNLRDFWQSPATSMTGRSFALNSNREMYGGGYEYFETTLKAFNQPAGYFSLGNKYWRFIGLDSGYGDHDLNADNFDWLKGQLSGTAKTILLSHHQPFSAFAAGDLGALRGRVQPFFDKIYGWF